MSEANSFHFNEGAMSRNRNKRSAPKVRTGCQPCRQRRIKCDEVHPDCGRCVRASRSCHYNDQFVVLVANNGRPRRLNDRRECGRLVSNMPNANPLSLAPTYGTNEEARYLELFILVAAPRCGRYCHKSLFDELLPQSSWCHPVIRHALVSVAMAFEHYTQMPNYTTRSDRHIWHYGRALSYLNTDFRLHTGSRADSRIILITCTLLWLHDNLMNDIRAALIHLKGFLDLMVRAKRKMIAQNQSNGLEQMIYQNMVFWGHSADPAFAKSPDASMIAIIREKLNNPFYPSARHDLATVSEEAFLCVYSTGWAVEAIEAASEQRAESTITFKELQMFVDRWYLAYSTQPHVDTNDHTILVCWYLCLCVVIYTKRDATKSHDPYVARILETLLIKLESLYDPDVPSLRLLEREPIMPVIPVVTEVIRMALNTDMRARAFVILRNLKRFETFWNSDIVATFLSTITWDETYEAKRISATKVAKSMDLMDLQAVDGTQS